jgi:predicted GNAT family N-acyltransferase
MKKDLSHLNIQAFTWQQAEPALRKIRTDVFLIEQAVPLSIEWDAFDASAMHLLATLDGNPVGCARLISNRIGRMAVQKNCRGFGVGRAILDFAVQTLSKNGEKIAILSSQTHAIDFYLKAGFIIVSDIYQDANIPHVDMQRILEK